MNRFIGRQEVLKQLNQLLDKKIASLVVIYGRRRIGKSSLINYFSKEFKVLCFEGLAPRANMTRQDQLDEFSRQLAQQCNTTYEKFTDWSDALYRLSKYTNDGRIIVVLDEISWMSVDDPDLPGKIKIAWDKHFKKNNKLIFFICGSVSAWIKDNIVNSTGFYGRISMQICLKEIALDQCKFFWEPYKDQVSASEKLKILSITGGIPKYLEEINPKITADENIRRLAFTDTGVLFNDFDKIFSDSLTKKSDFYKKIVRLLCNTSVDSKELSNKLKISKGSYLSNILYELKMAGFISHDLSWNIKTGKISKVSQYRLSDNYLRFYLKYIEPNAAKISAGNFTNCSLHALPGYSSIISLQIENLVLNNRNKIKKLLAIMPDEIIADNPYLQRATSSQQGCQIDYMIQTKFNNLYVCEIKHTRSIIKSYIIDEVSEKIRKLKVPKNTSIRPVLICMGDIHDDVLDKDYFAKIIKIEELLDDLNAE